MIVDMTNLYAHRDKGESKFVTKEVEIRLFLAILLLSGYNSSLRRSMYWDTRSDIRNAKGGTSTRASPTTWGLGEVVLLFLEVLLKRMSSLTTIICLTGLVTKCYHK